VGKAGLASHICNENYDEGCMLGVKDAEQESLVGQAGEIEPVYDEYTLSFFLFDPATREVHLGCLGATEHKTGLRKALHPKVPKYMSF
jgi:hypothetical protein